MPACKRSETGRKPGRLSALDWPGYRGLFPKRPHYAERPVGRVLASRLDADPGAIEREWRSHAHRQVGLDHVHERNHASCVRAGLEIIGRRRHNEIDLVESGKSR